MSTGLRLTVVHHPYEQSVRGPQCFVRGLTSRAILHRRLCLYQPLQPRLLRRVSPWRRAVIERLVRIRKADWSSSLTNRRRGRIIGRAERDILCC